MAMVADFILLSTLHGDGAAVTEDYGAVASMVVDTMVVDTMAAVTAVDITDPTASTVLRETEVPSVQAMQAEAIIAVDQEEEPTMVPG